MPTESTDIVNDLLALRDAKDPVDPWTTSVTAARAVDEIVKLRRWKTDSLVVMKSWETAWEAFDAQGLSGKPVVGVAKSEIVLRRVSTLRKCVDAVKAWGNYVEHRYTTRPPDRLLLEAWEAVK